MRLYFHANGEPTIRNAPQQRTYTDGRCTYKYDRSARLWFVYIHDDAGNVVDTVGCTDRALCVTVCLEVRRDGLASEYVRKQAVRAPVQVG
jgi:hypothetical protein